MCGPCVCGPCVCGADTPSPRAAAIDEIKAQMKASTEKAETRITELGDQVATLEEFRVKRLNLMDAQKDHKKEVVDIRAMYEDKIRRLHETHKNNEIRWADDIRKQRATMEASVTASIQGQQTAKNEMMRREHEQMSLDLKHQAALMKSVMTLEEKKTEEIKTVKNEVVVANAMQVRRN